MGKGGRKYRLLMYEYILNRWWPNTLMLAFVFFLYVGGLRLLQSQYPNSADNPFPTLSATGEAGLVAVGIISLLVTIYFLITRKMAYVQLFDDHLRMVTPYLRLNISYKRIQSAATTQMYKVFPPEGLSRGKREIIESVLGSTVIVMQVSAYPLSRKTLGLFLSPFFFYDESPHFVFMIRDWMKFSSELESRRTLFKSPPRRSPPPAAQRKSGLLDDLMRK